MTLISIRHEKAYRVSATIGSHQLLCDVSVGEGGTDTGPSPVALLVASLGACMAMHVAKYCRTAKLPHEGLQIDLDYQLVKNPLRVGSVAVDISLPAGFPADRVEAVKRAAQECTVKNTFKDSTTVEVEVYFSS